MQVMRNAAKMQQQITGEHAIAVKGHHSLLSEHQEEEDPDVNDNEQLQYDAEISSITGLDCQHDNGADEYCQKWLWYVSEKEALMGASVIKGQGSSAITWTVRSNVTDANIPENINNEFKNVDVK